MAEQDEKRRPSYLARSNIKISRT